MIKNCWNVVIGVLFFLTLSSIYALKVRNKQRNMLFVVRPESTSRNETTLLVVTWSSNVEGEIGGCEVFDDQNLIAEVLSSAQDSEIQSKTESELKDLLNECTEVKVRKKRQLFSGFSLNSKSRMNRGMNSYNNNSPNNPTSDNTDSTQQNGKEMTTNTADGTSKHTTQSSSTKYTTEDSKSWDIIVPGTKWCGAGDTAESYDDLGIYNDTDSCCRAHDMCNDTIAAGETKYNLTNNTPFTTLSCQCDHDFYKCLEKVNSAISNQIGGIYFNILRRQCYMLDYPPTSKCKSYRSFLKLYCQEYVKNYTAPKMYEWEPAKLYKRLPLLGTFH